MVGSDVRPMKWLRRFWKWLTERPNYAEGGGGGSWGKGGGGNGGGA